MSQKMLRIPWIDELRGLAILAMILHHICFNLIYFLELSVPWLEVFLEGMIFKGIQTAFVAVFLCLSGICCHLTHHPLKRAARVFTGALAVTAVTYFLYPDEAIWFGILHCLAFCMALYAFLKPYADRIPPRIGIPVFIAIFIFTFGIPNGQILGLALPETLYRGGILMPLGFPSPTFQSLDYVPLLPHLFLFCIGVTLGNRVLPVGKTHSRFLAFCGRHSLFIYLVHQPAVFGIFFILSKIL